MTRETKIGLLVGLAFIIVIGILLSDHLTTRGELPAAQLTDAGGNVRQGAAVPTPAYPPITPVVVPTGVQPTVPVPTHDEINQAPGQAIVRVTGPSAAGARPTVVVQPPVISEAAVVTAGGMEDAVVTRAPVDGGLPELSPVLATNTPPATPGNTVGPADIDSILVPVQGSGLTAGGTPAAPVKAGAKEYKAKEGDTVSRMASRMMPGGNTNANRQLIIDANPSLKSDPAKVVIGRTYMIPTAAAAVNAAEQASATEPASTETVTTVVKTETKADAKQPSKSGGTYTAREKDTLWKIAETQLGDGSLWKEIRDLNKDVLKGGDRVKPGMTLKIPSKTSVASR